jgi:hypothetical protein
MGVGAAVAGATVVGGIGSALISSSASKSAASQEANAANAAAAQQAAQYAQTRADLQPYNQVGQDNLNIYGNFFRTSADQLGDSFSRAQDAIPQAMTEANLINTPGYQFNLSQGMRAIQNSNAAKGLGVSGSALQGAAKYATGLADSTYQNQFNNQQTQFQDQVSQFNNKVNQLNTIYGQIQAPVTTGANAAAMTGQLGQQASQNISNSLISAGNAQAAGTTGSANALAGGLQSVGNAGLNYLGIQNALSGPGYQDTTSGFY